MEQKQELLLRYLKPLLFQKIVLLQVQALLVVLLVAERHSFLPLLLSVSVNTSLLT
jgi:hypothetical protein